MKIYDIPGLGDPDMPIQEWVDEIYEGIPSKENIDIAIMVLKSEDYRMNSEQILTAEAMGKFIKNLKPKCTYLAFTHCDKDEPSDEFIEEKLKSILKYTDLEIPIENVIKFSKSKKSLEEFVGKFIKGKAQIDETIKNQIEEYKKKA